MIDRPIRMLKKSLDNGMTKTFMKLLENFVFIRSFFVHVTTYHATFNSVKVFLKGKSMPRRNWSLPLLVHGGSSFVDLVHAQRDVR